MAEQTPQGAQRLDIATELAFERTTAAYERTMMSWIRTATSLITFGFSIYKFFQIEAPSHKQQNRLIGPREFAFMLVSIGVLVLRYKEPERPRPFRVPMVWPVCLLSAAACIFIMKGLPDQAWERFGGWLVIGLILYFAYGFKHSTLGK